jgi:hypothetical protein
MLIFMNDAAEAVTSPDGQVRDRVWIGDRLWERV